MPTSATAPAAALTNGNGNGNGRSMEPQNKRLDTTHSRAGTPARALLWVAVLGAAAAAVLLSGCAAWRLGEAGDLVKRSQAFQQTPAVPALRLLIVGDSTGVGTGAATPQGSVAGRLAQAHPRLQIENRAVNGAKFADVLQQLAGAGRQDIVLVMAGGNDVIRLTGPDELRQQIDAVAQQAHALAPTVIFMPCGNVGNAPFFFPPGTWLMTQRSRALHRMVADIAARRDAVYVNLFKERSADPFTGSDTLNASDGLHPSSAGYQLWVQTLDAQAGMQARLAPSR